MRTALGVFVAAFVVLLVCGASVPASGTVAARHTHQSLKGLLESHMTKPPRNYYPGVAWDWSVPVAIDASGDVLVDSADSGCCDELGRYNPWAGTWIHGTAEVGAMGTFVPSPLGGGWGIGGNNAVDSALLFAFSNRAGRCRVCHEEFASLGFVDDVAVGSRGGAWIAGWSSHYKGWHPARGGRHAPGLPRDIPPGQSLLLFVGPKVRSFVKIRVPAPAPMTGVAIAREGTVWLNEMFNVCIGSGASRRCLPPRLVSYAPKTHRFRTFVIPDRDRPVHRQGGAWDTSLRTPMAVAPDGWVWSLFPVRGPARRGRSYLELVGLKNGLFKAFRIPVSYIPVSEEGLTPPIIDGHDQVWLMDPGNLTGPPIMVDARTGRWSSVRLNGGYLLQDFLGRLWYVVPPSHSGRLRHQK